MKTLSSLALGVTLCLFLTSCVVTSDNPLSSPEAAKPDPKLIGDWFQKKDQETFHFTETHGGWMHVVITPKPVDKAGNMINRKPEEYDFFPTTIGDNTFLNVVLIGKDDKDRPTKGYVFLRYTIEHDHVLQMWMISQDEVAAAVRAGNLKGVVQEDKEPIMVGHPPHPDVDVALQSSSSHIVKFIESSDLKKLFSDKMEPLRRIKSASN